MEATHAALVAIAAQSLSNMRVALGGSAVDAGSMSAEQLLSAHSATLATFKEKFRAGGVAATTPAEQTNDSTETPAAAHWQARVKATSLR